MKLSEHLVAQEVVSKTQSGYAEELNLFKNLLKYIYPRTKQREKYKNGK